MIQPASTIAHAPPVSRRNIWALVRDYVALTKPKIILLLVLTATGAMFLAAEGSPPLSTVLLVLFGGGLAAGGANALNQYWDRDIDERMARTSSRPLPDQRIDPRNALYFGAALNVIAFVILSSWVNLLAASLTLAATVFYVLVYTNWLKRTTTQNIVIGGAAGAIPPLVGWAAITGDLSLAALYMFAIVFFWTPPHFWALAVLLRNDYARAGVPMLPVVHGCQRDGAADPAAQLHAGRPLGAVLYRRGAGMDVLLGRARPRRGLPRPGPLVPQGADGEGGAGPLSLLAAVPRAAVRLHHHR